MARACPHGVAVPDVVLLIDIPCSQCFDVYLDWLADDIGSTACLCGGHSIQKPNLFREVK